MWLELMSHSDRPELLFFLFGVSSVRVDVPIQPVEVVLVCFGQCGFHLFFNTIAALLRGSFQEEISME